MLYFISIFIIFQNQAPQFLINTTMLIGYAAIFLVLASLGIALSTLKTKNIYETSILSAFRLLVGPIVGFLIIDYFNLKSYEAGIVLIQYVPSAILNFLLAKMYSRRIHATNSLSHHDINSFIIHHYTNYSVNCFLMSNYFVSFFLSDLGSEDWGSFSFKYFCNFPLY